MPENLTAYSCEYVMSTPLTPQPFIVHRMLCPGLYLLAGAPKLGKSWLALDLCLSVASGEPFLRHDTSAGQLIRKHVEADEFRSESDFLEKAARFYVGFLESHSEHAAGYLTQILPNIIEQTQQKSEDRMNRNLFKIAFHLDILTHLIAAMLEVDEENLSDLKSMCMDEVRHLNGTISVEDAIRFQRGDH